MEHICRAEITPFLFCSAFDPTFWNIFGGYQFFCWATTTPVLDFWWHLPWVSKPGWIHSLACFVACMQKNHEIHLWCDTSWPLGGQLGSQTIPIHVLVNKHWWDQLYHWLTAWDKTDALPTEKCRLGTFDPTLYLSTSYTPCDIEVKKPICTYYKDEYSA